MDVSVKFPLTNRELFDLGGGKPLRFAATFAEFWEVVETSEYRVDFFDHQIIASMSYESEDHSALTTRLSHLLQNIFWDNPAFKVHNSNRPICIPDCDHAVFNPDGSVVSQPAKLYEYQPGMNAELSPVFLFEVLSKNTRAYDLGDKLPCYKKIPTLQQILYLEPLRMEVTLFERLEGENRWLETMYRAAGDQILVNGAPIVLKQIYG